MAKKSAKIRRRDFLKTIPAAIAGIAGFPTIVRASALGKSGAVAPSNRIVMAGIGFGMMGIPNMQAFLEKDEVQ
ncbi:MAG: twin-arginine translocation signal domain-containing protein, partial [Candidatus Aminicenantes bacterium]|nr:twin-arginine translocation signal domain-containing protein [Candidatus Aminicenantes bacterium]